MSTQALDYRDNTLPSVRLDVLSRADGTLLLKSQYELVDFDPIIARNFFAQVKKQPDKTIYAQRQRLADGTRGDWRRLSFREAGERVESMAQWLLDQGLQPRDVVLLVSGNSIHHALMRLACLSAGICACPISMNYGLAGGNFARLKYVLDLVQPKVIFAEDSALYAQALQAINLNDRIVISADPAATGVTAVALQSIMEHPATAAVQQGLQHADADEHAVYVLTSGSTGMPKAVIQTQRMLSTNLFQAFQTLGSMSGWDDVMLDWLPWSHVSGGFNLLAAAVFGGSLYIDEGKPAPGLFNETLRNLGEISIPYFCNVPAGFTWLVEALEEDAELRKTFYSKLRMVLYGGAGLPQPILDRLQKMASAETGQRIFITSGYGATETASGCMAIYYDTDKVGIGLPMPGLEVKLVPNGDRYEIRLRGDNIMPGYLHNPKATAAAFDEEGFYRTGDAARFHADDDAAQGLYFAGRLSEEFKLGTGTWVYAGQVRARVVEALAPAISDLLLCGLGRNYLAVLGAPSLAGLREIAGEAKAQLPELLQHPKVLDYLQAKLQSYNQAFPGSSTAIRRFSFMREAPSAARHELSDKGTVNQSIAAENRSGEIEALFANTPSGEILQP
ncbi:MAG: AMP-binding protein [Xanthomonadales bacterium]|nr:AMP-binding protein [Xanthomonadales bacterium]